MHIVPRPTRPRRGRGALAAATLLSLATAGQLVLTIAPAAAATGIVRGTVYRDSNNNGLRDAGEAGVAGIVIASGTTSAVSDSRGSWAMTLGGTQRVSVITGWHRSICDDVTCSARPALDQDFTVRNQLITTVVDADANPVLDAGIVPDWPGGYPMPSQRPVPANIVDVSARVSFLAPTGAPRTSNCFRTEVRGSRTCAIGDRPSFAAHVFNEGTTAISNPSGYLQLPAGTSVVSMVPSIAPANHPALGGATLGAMSLSNRRVPFTIRGMLPPGGAAVYTVTLLIHASAPVTPAGSTSTTALGVRVNSVTKDVEGDSCGASPTTSCAWGRPNRQLSPDNSAIVSFTIVAAPDTTSPTTTSPTTTSPATTSPATTLPATTLPATTVPATTSPASTVPATTLPATTVPGGACRVSAILVPSCGAWLGASTAPSVGDLDGAGYARGLGEYEAVAGNVPDILHFYKTGAVTFPTSNELAMANRAGKQRSILHYNWKPSSSLTWRQIALGAADTAIATVADGLQASPHKVFLAIYHEPEDQIQGAGSGFAPADYVAMFRHVVTQLRAHGVDNAVFVMNYMGYMKWSTVVDALYPGDDVVDWIAYDPYGFSSHHDFGQFLDTPRSPWPGFYTWATTKAPGKPIMLAEWGFDLNEASQAPELLDSSAAIAQSRYPMVKALVYWHDDDGGFKVRLDQRTSLGERYGQAYRRFANHPYFNATPTSAAP